MSSILAIISDTCCNQFKCVYLKKQNTFSQYFIAFLESKLHFGHLAKKLQPQSLNISGIIHSEKSVSLNAWQVLFQKTLRQSVS